VNHIMIQALHCDQRVEVVDEMLERVVQGSRGRDVSNRFQREEAGGDVMLGRVARWPSIYLRYSSRLSYLSCGVLNVMNLDTIST
jgi:hypothetical protein